MENNYTHLDLAEDLAPLVISQLSKANVKFTPSVVVTERILWSRIQRLWDRVAAVVRGKAKQKDEEKMELELDNLMDLTICPQTIFCVRSLPPTLKTHRSARL